MDRLFRTTSVDAPFSSVIEYVAAFFEEHPRLLVKAIGPAGVPVETHHEVTGDKTDDARRHDAVMLRWRPGLPLFPAFEGCVTVRPNSTGSILRLEGSYEVPGGRLGRTFDRFIGARLANGTMDHLLGRLRRDVERRYSDFVRTTPTIEQLNEAARAAENSMLSSSNLISGELK